MNADNNMRLDVFPDMIHPLDDEWPPAIPDWARQAVADGACDPQPSSMDLLLMLVKDLDAAAEHASKLIDQLPDDARVLFRLSFVPHLLQTHNKLHSIKKYLLNCASGEVAPTLRQKIGALEFENETPSV